MKTYQPIPRPAYAFPIFAAIFALALFGERFIAPVSGLALLVTVLLLPFYVVRLLLFHRSSFGQPDPRVWVAIYVVLFMLTTWLFLLLKELLKT